MRARELLTSTEPGAPASRQDAGQDSQARRHPACFESLRSKARIRIHLNDFKSPAQKFSCCTPIQSTRHSCRSRAPSRNEAGKSEDVASTGRFKHEAGAAEAGLLLGAHVVHSVTVVWSDVLCRHIRECATLWICFGAFGELGDRFVRGASLSREAEH